MNYEYMNEKIRILEEQLKTICNCLIYDDASRDIKLKYKGQEIFLGVSEYISDALKNPEIKMENPENTNIIDNNIIESIMTLTKDGDNGEIENILKPLFVLQIKILLFRLDESKRQKRKIVDKHSLMLPSSPISPPISPPRSPPRSPPGSSSDLETNTLIIAGMINDLYSFGSKMTLFVKKTERIGGQESVVLQTNDEKKKVLKHLSMVNEILLIHRTHENVTFPGKLKLGNTGLDIVDYGQGNDYAKINTALAIVAIYYSIAIYDSINDLLGNYITDYSNYLTRTKNELNVNTDEYFVKKSSILRDEMDKNSLTRLSHNDYSKKRILYLRQLQSFSKEYTHAYDYKYIDRINQIFDDKTIDYGMLKQRFDDLRKLKFDNLFKQKGGHTNSPYYHKYTIYKQKYTNLKQRHKH